MSLIRQLLQYLGIALILFILVKPYTGYERTSSVKISRITNDLPSDKLKPRAVEVGKMAGSFEKQVEEKLKPEPKKVEVASITINKTPEEISVLIDKYAMEFNADPNLMKSIARCESGFRAEATNGNFGGMYQFLASTWSSNRNAMGLDPNPDLRFNAEEAIKTAAFKMGRDGYGAWPSCYSKALAQI